MTFATPKLPRPSDPQLVKRSQSSAREAWRMFEIIAEFVTRPSACRRSSPRCRSSAARASRPRIPFYKSAEDISRRLSEAGFAVISGGGPGIMEAVNKGAYEGSSPSVGLNIELPHEQSANSFQDVSHTFQHFFARKVMFVKHSCAFVMMPGGLRHAGRAHGGAHPGADGKIRRIPIILVHSPFWKGLIGLDRGDPQARGNDRDGRRQALPGDRRPPGVVEAIFNHYHSRGFQPTPSEREAELAL
jgi:uncharacterized protein (TIGR00730 family)